MNAVGYMRVIHWVGLLLLWPPVVFAAGLTFDQSIRAITGATVLGWLLLSTLSGVTALFYRFDRELKRTKRLPNPGVFVVAHMTGSWTMGLVAYFSGESLGAPGLATAISIIVFSFGGAAALERLVERRMKALERDILPLVEEP